MHKIFLTAALVLASACLFSDEINSKNEGAFCKPKEISCELMHRVQIGGNYTYAWITPEGNTTTTGNLWGAQALYEYRPLDSIYAGAYFAWREGKTTNDVGERKIQDFNVQERLGYTIGFCDKSARLTPFTGIGARYLPETVTIDPNSVDYDYTEFYVPVGFLFEHELCSMLSWGVNFQWMPQVFPLVRMQPLGGAWWDLTYQIDNFFVEVPFKITSDCNQFSLSIAPFFETWHDGATTAKTDTLVVLNLGLPKNKYTFTGVNVNLGYAF
jgi:hypothetical protein